MQKRNNNSSAIAVIIFVSFVALVYIFILAIALEFQHHSERGTESMYEDINGNRYETPEHDENYYADLYDGDE